jgi:prepilin-type N-terminal cleavage/methylation domain-containing protein
MRKTEGFTLIELMIVIAIIAIIAAIAIPGLLQSQRASNERNASASLKTLASAEADFRANDRDADRIQDFWTEDISCLYGLIPVGSSDMIKLIELSVAGADFNRSTQATSATGAAGPAYVNPTNYTVNAPKAGYWYKAAVNDEEASVYATNTSGVVDTAGTVGTTNGRNHSKFAFIAFPDSFSAGRAAFFINEGNTIFKRPLTSNCRPAGAPPVTTLLTVGTSGIVGANPAEDWPTDSELKAQYSKLD